MQKNIPLLVATIIVALSPSAPCAAQTQAQFATVKKSLVRITVTTQEPDYRVPWAPGSVGGGIGTGFLIDGNRFMTNAHVVSNTRMLTIEKDGDPKKYIAEVEHIAHDCDLAVLKATDPAVYKGMKPLTLGGIPAIESTVNVYGFPIGGTRMSVTRGIVSRTDFQNYTHSGIDQHLAIQIDAAINPGNSGGPVLQDNKVVGVAFQGYSGDVAQSVGYMIPTPVIRRFLKDIQDTHYDRYVDLALSYNNLNNPAQRRALGLPDNDQGVLVSSVMADGSCDGALKPGDVLLEVDGHPISSDATIEMDGEQVDMPEVVERKYKGDKVTFKVLRDKKEQLVDVTLRPIDPYLIQGNAYDVNPRYVLFGGLLFQPMDRGYIDANNVNDLRIRYFYDHFVSDEVYKEYPEPVILSTILPDPINTYLTSYRQSIVESVNGKPIKKLDDLAAALDERSDFYEIRLIGEGRPIVLERAKVEEARPRILQRYRVLSERNLRAERN